MYEEERHRYIIEIEMFVEMNPNIYAKAAFYSDPEVRSILETLYNRWEQHNRKDDPLAYATIEELKILARKAYQYKDANASILMQGSIFEEMAYRAMRGTED